MSDPVLDEIHTVLYEAGRDDTPYPAWLRDLGYREHTYTHRAVLIDPEGDFQCGPVSKDSPPAAPIRWKAEPIRPFTVATLFGVPCEVGL